MLDMEKSGSMRDAGCRWMRVHDFSVFVSRVLQLWFAMWSSWYLVLGVEFGGVMWESWRGRGRGVRSHVKRGSPDYIYIYLRLPNFFSSTS